MRRPIMAFNTVGIQGRPFSSFELVRRLGEISASEKGASNFPVLALLILMAFLACGPFSDTAVDMLEPVLKEIRRLLR